MILFKYRAKLIAKGIFAERVDVEEISNGHLYPGYYLTEKDSIEIFTDEIDLETLNTYLPVKSLTRDQIFRKDHDKIMKMIDDYTN